MNELIEPEFNIEEKGFKFIGRGPMNVDADAFRFGSRYGDLNILVYKKD